MWLLTPKGGFVSIVRKMRDPVGLLRVRARTEADMDAFRTVCPELDAMHVHPRADYRYHATAPVDAVARAAVRLVEAITYDNFKSEVARVWGHARAHVYSEVWAVLMRLQLRERSGDDRRE